MPWQNKSGGRGGGPWGGNGGGRSGGPWGGGRGGGGGGQPPNFEDMIRRGQDNVKRVLPGGLGSPRGIIIIGLLVVVIWMLTGIYRVNPEQVGVELVFGKHVDTTLQGLHWNWPAPIGDVFRPNVTRENTTEVGFRSGPSGGGRGDRSISGEAEMLTGDENIIDIQVVVFWRIDQRPSTRVEDGEEEIVTTQGVRNFLFNIRNPHQAVQDVTEAALRQIVGSRDFEVIRTTGRSEIEGSAQELIQSILDDYGAGVQVLRVKLQNIDPPENVLNAFRDVQAARADKESEINEATAYLNRVVQEAQGEAEQIVSQAEAFREERISAARGETRRFLAVYEQYISDRDVTRRRIYMETMREVLRDMDMIMLTGEDGANVLPYLPLRELTNPRGPTQGDAGRTHDPTEPQQQNLTGAAGGRNQ